MTLKNDPVFASTVFSVGLHVALLLALLQLPAISLPTGNNLRIELMRSLAAPGQMDAAITEPAVQPPQAPAAQQRQAAADPPKMQSVASDPAPTITKAQPRTAVKPVVTTDGNRADGVDTQTVSVDADTRTAAMLELLHNEISHHKRYPYLARRQRREGTARVGFVLHPDGRIDNTAVLESSRSQVLDRAALSAVADIAPFKPAEQYLSQAQTFRIDVVFRLE